MHEASCPEEPGAGKLHAGICEGGAGQPASLPRQTLVTGSENDTVIVWFVESTVRAGFPLAKAAKQSLRYILPSVGATKLITFVVVGFAGFRAKVTVGEPCPM